MRSDFVQDDGWNFFAGAILQPCSAHVPTNQAGTPILCTHYKTRPHKSSLYSNCARTAIRVATNQAGTKIAHALQDTSPANQACTPIAHALQYASPQIKRVLQLRTQYKHTSPQIKRILSNCARTTTHVPTIQASTPFAHARQHTSPQIKRVLQLRTQYKQTSPQIKRVLQLRTHYYWVFLN